MPEVEKVLVVGAGIGGLSVAALLARQGKEVEVVEIKPDSTVLGVGINQPANSLRALRKIGVLDEILEAGAIFDPKCFYDYKGNPIVDVPSEMGGEDVPPNCALARRDLHEILIGAADRAGAKVRYGITIDDLEEAEDHVDVKLTDGTTGSYDLVVGFDGIRSKLRRRLFGDGHEPVYAGVAVWRLTVPRPAAVKSWTFYLSPHNNCGYIPLSDTSMYLLVNNREPEDARYAKEDLPRLLRERLEGYEGIIGEIRDKIEDGDDIVYAPLKEVLLPPPWHRGRVVLGGDAAHACVPHTTQGAAMALETAVVLAEELARASDLEAALTVYAGRRYPRAKFVQEVSRAVLDMSMAVTEENFQAAMEQMREAMPAQLVEVDEVLRQAA